MFRYTLTWNDEVYTTKLDPLGWEDSTVTINRSPKYHGFNYSQIADLTFTCDSGKEFIDNIYNTYGVDEEISILIEESCNENSIITNKSYNSDYSSDYEKGSGIIDANYSTIFDGIVDLKTIEILENTTSVKLIEQGKNQKFLSRLDTKVDLFQQQTIEGEVFTNIDQPYTINMHSKAITSTAEFESVEYIEEDIDVQDYPQFGVFLNIKQIIVASEDSQSLFVSYENSSDNEIFYNNTDSDANLKLDINIVGGLVFWLFLAGDDAYFTAQIGIRIGNDDSVFYQKIKSDQYITNINLVQGGTPVYVDFTCEDTLDFTVPAGQRVYLTIGLVDSGGPIASWMYVSGAFSFFELNGETISTTDASQALGQKIHETISKVAQVILDSETPLDSRYYGRVDSTPVSYDENGCGSFASITSGYMIRQYPQSYGISTSMNEILNSLNAIDGIGVGFIKKDNDWRLSIEPMAFFYNDAEIIALEHVPDIKRYFATDKAYNKISIGYSKWQTTNANGLDEYCSKSEYSLGLRSIPESLELISPFLASAYIIEEVRRMPYTDSSTTDTDYDNDIFIIALNRSLGYDGAPDLLNTAEKDENFTEINNVLSPETSYNLRYMNCKNFLRILPIVSPVITKYSNRNIIFTYGEGNKFAQTQDTIECPSYYNGELLTANQNIVWNTSGELPVFIPEYIEFEYPLSGSQFSQIKDCLFDKDNEAHNGYIAISNEEETFKGYIIEMKYKQINGMTTFKLIRKYD